jgi:hypothetical protein
LAICGGGAGIGSPIGAIFVMSCGGWTLIASCVPSRVVR